MRDRISNQIIAGTVIFMSFAVIHMCMSIYTLIHGMAPSEISNFSEYIVSAAFVVSVLGITLITELEATLNDAEQNKVRISDTVAMFLGIVVVFILLFYPSILMCEETIYLFRIISCLYILFIAIIIILEDIICFLQSTNNRTNKKKCTGV